MHPSLTTMHLFTMHLFTMFAVTLLFYDMEISSYQTYCNAGQGTGGPQKIYFNQLHI